jgi:hypothetical protein
LLQQILGGVTSKKKPIPAPRGATLPQGKGALTATQFYKFESSQKILTAKSFQILFFSLTINTCIGLRRKEASNALQHLAKTPEKPRFLRLI